MVTEEMPIKSEIDNPVMTNRLKMSLKTGVTDVNYNEYCVQRNYRRIDNDLQINI